MVRIGQGRAGDSQVSPLAWRTHVLQEYCSNSSAASCSPGDVEGNPLSVGENPSGFILFIPFLPLERSFKSFPSLSDKE